MNHNKKIFIIFTILVVLIIGATFAWWMWQNTEEENTNISLTVDGMTIEYDDGENIEGVNLIPVSSKEKGKEDGTGIYKEISVTAPMTTFLNLYMTLVVFPKELAEESLLYSIEKDEEVILSGNFSELKQGDRIQLLNRQEVGTVESIFKLYIWIDGNQANPTDMMNQSFSFVLNADGTTDPFSCRPDVIPVDSSGANKPNINNGLIPVRYDECQDVWVVADTDSNWYNYFEQKWANAVLVSDVNREIYKTAEDGTPIPEDDVLAYYVWIPKYKYKVFNITKTMGTDSYDAKNSGIDIVFESGSETTGTIECNYNFGVSEGSGLSEICTGNNGDYYTHPAFQFGGTYLEGIWVSKFEISTLESSSCHISSSEDNCRTTGLQVRVKPNANPWRFNYADYFSTVIQNMDNTGNEYGLAINSESHMLKNMEWGAVAYLANSQYGRCRNGKCEEVAINSYYGGNNETGFMTGCGPQSNGSIASGTICNDYKTNLGQSASTTGNIYGIYDMSGGAYEYVMGNMSSATGTYSFNQNGASTSFSYSTDTAKYIDTYAYGKTFNDQSAYNRARLGDATGEVTTTTMNLAWYDDNSFFVLSSGPWFCRGGHYIGGLNAGIFFFGANSGVSYSFYSTRAVLLAF